MDTIKIYTVVPKSVLLKTERNERIKNVRNVGRINDDVINAIKEKFIECVGYDNLPMAAIGSEVVANSLIADDTGIDSALVGRVENYIPINSHESTVLALSIPEDMILSIDHSTLLDINRNYEMASDEFDREDILDSLKESLSIGKPKGDCLSFIPFVEINKCWGMTTTDPIDDSISSSHEISKFSAMTIKQLIEFNK